GRQWQHASLIDLAGDEDALSREGANDDGQTRISQLYVVEVGEHIVELLRREAGRVHLIHEEQRDAAVGPHGDRLVELRIVEEPDLELVAWNDHVFDWLRRGRLGIRYCYGLPRHD